MIGPALVADLTPATATVLREFVASAQAACGEALRTVILFGSAAEGRLRATSDLNVLVIADRFTAEQLDAMRLELRTGRAACGLTVMFLVTADLAAAAEAFGLKFADIKARHRLLYGEPLLERLEVPREAARRRVQQVLLNLQVRLRELYVLEGDHAEKLALILADTVGPVRSSAATLRWLGGGERESPKVALQALFPDPRWAPCLAGLSKVHRGEQVAGAGLRELYSQLLELLDALRAEAAAC